MCFGAGTLAILLIGGMVGIISRSGGMLGVANRVVGLATTQRRAE